MTMITLLNLQTLIFVYYYFPFADEIGNNLSILIKFLNEND